MIDSHAHLYFDRFNDDLDSTVERARSAGVEKIVNVGVDAPTSALALELSNRYDDFFAAAGIHPTSRISDEESELREVQRLAERNPGRVVAIGEIGLDYHWKDVSPDVQRPRLTRQLRLARELGLPVIIHCREALEDLLVLMEAEDSLPSGVFHCFAGGPEDVRRTEALGFHISFAGNVTYPRAGNLQDAASVVDSSRLLLETDSPFLPPQPRRGRRCEPAFLEHTLGFLADLRGVRAAELEEQTSRNATRLFAL